MTSSSRDPWENDPLRQRARKIKPQYDEGELVRVVGASNQAEAEMIQGMLLEEGVPRSCAAHAASTCPTCSPPARATCSCPRRAS